ncbi:hypothetical protein GWK47_024527 [Chionoecetes opilio]|uniref:Uncharacterized protein n=1 Tax=Chionoecetes opilio TaxID=41210 RepID=A0A8J4XLA3_CHIOP|nr:hypothetical protein GWK47_024527 [Chionoecetes opilio]
MSGKRTVEDFFRVEASSSDVTQERERNISGSSGSVDIPTISRSSSLMSLGSEPEDSRPGTQASDQVDVVIAGGCSISSQELQTIKDKMAALTNYYKLSHVIKSKNAPDTSSKVLGKTIKVYNLKAKCQKCFAEVSFWNNTTGNLVSHYRPRTSRRGLKHPSGDDQPQRHQLSLKEFFGQATRFTQDKGKEAMTKWFARCLSPSASQTTQPPGRCFQVFQPEFRVPSRRTLTRDIKAMGEEAREEIKSILKDLPHVATTADSWTAHNRSFIGSTVHWIDPTDLSRKMATLAIKEIKVSQTKGIIATKLDQVNRAFNISRKVVLTTTDNGANYVAAFSNYGSGIGEAEEDATNPDVEEVINSPEDQEGQGGRALTSSASPWPLLQQLQCRTHPGCPSIKDAGK